MTLRTVEFYNLPEHREDLMKYFKYTITCSKCNKIFGADGKKCVAICPVCELIGANELKRINNGNTTTE